jgi:signal transduction histidine kinase
VTWEAFDQALATFADEFSQDHEVDARVWSESAEVMLDGSLQAEVLRILHEACSNAIRHGQASRIDAYVAVQGGVLRLTVRDNGRGFEPARAPRGVGLRSMAERVERRHGRLLVDAAPGRGTRIHAWLPLATRPELA